jgi:hypothetical protein
METRSFDSVLEQRRRRLNAAQPYAAANSDN